TSTSVTLTANTIGTGGNSIVLTGDGVSDINTLIANWNIANPSNQVTLTSGNGLQIPSNLATASLSGGINAGVIGLSGGFLATIQLSGGTGGTTLVTAGLNGAPPSSGTLTKTSGTGDATI